VKGEAEMLYSSLQSPKYTMAADELRPITWVVQLVLIWIHFT